MVDAGGVDIQVGDEAQADEPGGQHAVGFEVVQQRGAAAALDLGEDDIGLRWRDGDTRQRRQAVGQAARQGVVVGQALDVVRQRMVGRSGQQADLAVVVAEGDALSEAVGAAYLAARGVPAANLVRVRVNTANDVISAADFALLKADIDARLPAGVQATLLTWAAPSRVFGTCSMGITSAMAFGYDARWCNPAPTTNTCAATAVSPLYDSESRRPQADLQVRPSMLLGARTVAAAQALISRGVAADATRPSGDAWLVRTTDADRSVRWTDFAGLPAAWSGALTVNYLDNSSGPATGNSLSGRSGLLFYLTGLANVDQLATLQFRPGALADTLTSFSGLLPGANGQLRHGRGALQPAAEVLPRLHPHRPLLARRDCDRGLLACRAMAGSGPVCRRAAGPALPRYAELRHRQRRVPDQDPPTAPRQPLHAGVPAGRQLDGAGQLHRRARPAAGRPCTTAPGGGDPDPLGWPLPEQRGQPLHAGAVDLRVWRPLTSKRASVKSRLQGAAWR